MPQSGAGASKQHSHQQAPQQPAATAADGCSAGAPVPEAEPQLLQTKVSAPQQQLQLDRTIPVAPLSSCRVFSAPRVVYCPEGTNLAARQHCIGSTSSVMATSARTSSGTASGGQSSTAQPVDLQAVGHTSQLSQALPLVQQSAEATQAGVQEGSPGQTGTQEQHATHDRMAEGQAGLEGSVEAEAVDGSVMGDRAVDALAIEVPSEAAPADGTAMDVAAQQQANAAEGRLVCVAHCTVRHCWRLAPPCIAWSVQACNPTYRHCCILILLVHVGTHHSYPGQAVAQKKVKSVAFMHLYMFFCYAKIDSWLCYYSLISRYENIGPFQKWCVISKRSFAMLTSKTLQGQDSQAASEDSPPAKNAEPAQAQAEAPISVVCIMSSSATFLPPCNSYMYPFHVYASMSVNQVTFPVA